MPTFTPHSTTTTFASDSSSVTESVIWRSWSHQYLLSAISTGATSTSVYTTSASTWSAWNQSYGSTATIATDTWSAWNRTYGTSSSSSIVAASHARNTWRDTRTPEQVAAQRNIDAEAARERAKAKERAALLLQEALNEPQRAELRDKGFFTLETIRPTGERRIYRIHRGRSQNVQQVDAQGRRIKTLCAHPSMLVPDEDTMLAQKLMLESMEDEFLRVANHS